MNVRPLARVMALGACVLMAGAQLAPVVCSAKTIKAPASRPEETEWTWEVRPPHPDRRLPNVLLLGDSISRNYYPEVQRQLKDVANVYLFASSISLGDPRLLREIHEFGVMEAVSFRVVHLNNGMHGWSYSEDEYGKAFPAYLKSIRKIARGAALVWASTTPVKTGSEPGPTNARVDARNKIAEAVMRANGVSLDDQHKLMMQHLDTYEDNVHFNSSGADIQGKQVAASIRPLLGNSSDKTDIEVKR